MESQVDIATEDQLTLQRLRVLEVLQFLRERPKDCSSFERVQEWNLRCRELGCEDRLIPPEKFRDF